MNANTVFFGRGYNEDHRAAKALAKEQQAKEVRRARQTDWRTLADQGN